MCCLALRLKDCYLEKLEDSHPVASSLLSPSTQVHPQVPPIADFSGLLVLYSVLRITSKINWVKGKLIKMVCKTRRKSCSDDFMAGSSLCVEEVLASA